MSEETRVSKNQTQYFYTVPIEDGLTTRYSTFEQAKLASDSLILNGYKVKIHKVTELIVSTDEVYATSILPNLKEAMLVWMPALVKFQKVPSWWKLVEEKSKLMGKVILVRALTNQEMAFNKDYAGYENGITNPNSLIKYKSTRIDNLKPNAKNTYWNWAENDLILYPTKEQVTFVEKSMRLAAGYAHYEDSKI